MINIPREKIYNAYIIETYNYENIKNSIKEFAIANGFDRILVESGNHPDIYFMEEENKSIKIDDIRQNVIEKAIYAPKIADKKIFVIYNAIYLEPLVQNAMLKTLEEPQPFDIFFLVTSNANKLLETIRSRCVMIKDNEEIDYKELLKLDYLKEALNVLANIKYDSAGKKMMFAEKFNGKNNNLKMLIMLYRYVIRDALFYKVTLKKESIYLREMEDDIISIANSLSLEDFGKLIDKFDLLVDANRYNNINRKIALFNFLEV